MAFPIWFPRRSLLPLVIGCALLCGAKGMAAFSSHRDMLPGDGEPEYATFPREESGVPTHPAFEAGSRKQELTPLFELLHALPLMNGATINPKARYVVCLYSASWCGPCRRELPGIVAHYLAKTDQGRKKGDMEMILFDFDHSEADARAWIARERVPFPATYHAPESLPGARSVGSIPTMIVLDAQGNILMKGSPAEVLSHWDAIAEGRVRPAAERAR